MNHPAGSSGGLKARRVKQSRLITDEMLRGTKTPFGGQKVMIKRPLMLFIYIYKKFISPVLPRVCRFYPSCSGYAYDAIELHGASKGVLLAVLRILRCHPFNPGGYDPVPDPYKHGPAQKITGKV